MASDMFSRDGPAAHSRPTCQYIGDRKEAAHSDHRRHLVALLASRQIRVTAIVARTLSPPLSGCVVSVAIRRRSGSTRDRSLSPATSTCRPTRRMSSSTSHDRERPPIPVQRQNGRAGPEITSHHPVSGGVHLGLGLGSRPSACLHAGSSFSSDDPPYASVSETGTTPGSMFLGPYRRRHSA